MSWAESSWRLVGESAAACGDPLEGVLERAPRKQERDWIAAGYDAYKREAA